MAAAAGVGRDQTQINQNGNDEFAGLLLDEKETEDFQQFVLQLLHQTKDQSIREIPFTSISHDNVDSSYSYADELEQFLLLHQENQEIPEALTSSGPLRASNINKMCANKKVNKFLKLNLWIDKAAVVSTESPPSHLFEARIKF